MSGKSFDPSNSASLDDPVFVLRDSLGALAIQILSTREDFSKMSYEQMLRELLDIIIKLHTAYDQAHL